ncbi:MAG: nitrogen permease regulator 2-domain-containing protein [Linnemannia gamsii]|nr:MAG: nitrogen permease regulator 2-domain-containing protein [Linnemannia gamsii]
MGFPRLLSIFYCTFHPTQGPKVLYEVPEGSILSKTSPLVDFDSISEYLIPKVELCAKLVTISTPTCKVIGYPINLEHKKFQRNALMFNLAFVFDKDAEISSYEPVVRKMARVLKALEKESEFLTDGSGMQNLIEQLIEDLNSYCECQIPIDTANTINLKLFPTYPNPAPVYDYQVPISTVNLEALTDVNWDMTMQRITGYINGVNSVKRIAEYADVETGLARMCMEHLLYYGCIIMVDLFQFKNIYAVKMEMMRLTEDVALQYECVAYVTLPDMHAPSFAKIFSLYCSLQYGVVLQDWIEQNQIADYNIDVRRFISFGVIKGFLYRVHKYPILDYYDPAALGSAPSSAPSSAKRLNGQHHYDELCTHFGCSVRDLDKLLATDSRVKFIFR